MIRLRHIKGPRLQELELALEGNGEALNVIGVNKVNDDWYIHFTTDSVTAGKVPKNRKIEVNNGTKTLEKS